MAELQWIIEVRCVNTLLAAFSVCERGQHIGVHVPENRNLDPHEFGKLIEGAEEARRLAELHRGTHKAWTVSQAPLDVEMGAVSEIERRHDIYNIKILKSGEIIVVTAGGILGPSELDQFIAEMKAIQGRLAPTE